MDWAKDFGLTELSAQSISELNTRLMGDDQLLADYMAKKSGFAQGGQGQVTPREQYSCLQLNSMYLSEVLWCRYLH